MISKKILLVFCLSSVLQGAQVFSVADAFSCSFRHINRPDCTDNVIHSFAPKNSQNAHGEITDCVYDFFRDKANFKGMQVGYIGFCTNFVRDEVRLAMFDVYEKGSQDNTTVLLGNLNEVRKQDDLNK
jgi:hypothetical protein